MASGFIGRNMYAYVATYAIANLFSMSHEDAAETVKVDPDISNLKTFEAAVSSASSGSMGFNLTHAGDYQNMRPIIVAGSTVAVYMYPERGSSKVYQYGNILLKKVNWSVELTGTAKCALDWAAADSSGITTATTAA